jgi:transcriptional regulator with XRE-family HTH domain
MPRRAPCGSLRTMPLPHRRSRTTQRRVSAALQRIERRLADDLARARIDAGATLSAVASAAGVDRTQIGRIERATTHPTLETLVACATVIGAEVSIRIYTGTSPRLTDRHQARMVECVLRQLDPVWRARLEVPVPRPVRGVVDTVFARRDAPLLVVGEFQSTLPRLEQQLRWMAEKADALATAEGVPASRLLVLRSTEATRSIVRQFEATLRAAYPARTRDAVDSLRTGAPWPGAAIAWIRIEGGHVDLLGGPPRGVNVGR